jgi:micrococcal nuclease
MRTCLALLLATAFALPAGTMAAAGAKSPAKWDAAIVKARVTWVVDGDTISVRLGDVRERIRLIGVDTPETNDIRDEYKQAAYDARDWLIARLKGRTVALESDPVVDDRDKHGRLLRYVYLDGENVNLSLVQEGWGWTYRRFAFSKKAEFLSAEAEAEANRTGVWSLPDGPRRRTR